MSLCEEYFKLMLDNDSGKAYWMEVEHGLDGYPPELVSVGLAAIDAGKDPFDAINEYADWSH